jgi:hypothetical protein
VLQAEQQSPIEKSINRTANNLKHVLQAEVRTAVTNGQINQKGTTNNLKLVLHQNSCRQ